MNNIFLRGGELEAVLLGQLQLLGYVVAADEVIGPNDRTPGTTSPTVH